MSEQKRVEICNKALRMLPHKRITSLDDDSLAARECNAVYTTCRDELFSDHPWSFLRVTRTLAGVENKHPDKWSDAYAAPRDLLQAIRIYPSVDASVVNEHAFRGALIGDMYNSIADRSRRFEILDNVLYCNIDGVTLEYTKPDVSEGDFSAKFISALAARIASEICMPITKSSKRENILLQRAQMFLDEAKELDENVAPDEQGDYVPESIQARLSGA